MNIRVALAAALFACSLAGATQAEPYPVKTVTIIVPASAGGVVDRMARTLAPQLAAAWGNQVIVENKPGANNQIGAEYVARANPDGATLFLSPESTFVVNPYVYSKLQYKLSDFAPISGLFSIYQCLCANPAFPANTVAELIALAKSKPGSINYGTFGVGSSGHLNMEMFSKMAGVKLTAVHYKGAAPATNDVIGGHIQLISVAIGSAVPQMKGGKLKALGVGSPKRLAKLPNVPAVAETVPGYEAASWFGLFGPAKMPRPLVDRINADVRQIFEKPEIKKFLDVQFFEPMTDSPDDFAAFIKTEGTKWSKVAHDAGIKLD